MTKRYFIIVLVLLFLALSASARMTVMMVGGAGECADCSVNDASFIWEANSTTVGDVGYSPCGCSDGSTTMTGSGDAAISAGSGCF